MRTDILDRKEEILQWIENNESKAFIARQLKCKIQTLEKYLFQMGIIYSGNQPLKGKKKKKPNTSYIPAEEYLGTDKEITSQKLKEKLLKEDIKEFQCEICKNTEWNGKPIPLELHHKDGDHYNNELSNLLIVCPNCHAQMPVHFLEKSKGTEKNVDKEKQAEELSFEISRQQLKIDIRYHSFAFVANKYSTTEKQIRELCDFYRLPRTKELIRAYSPNKWEEL